MPAALAVAASTAFQLRVCTGKVCKKQGSPQIAKFAQDLQLPQIEVQTCGCLSECGNGPNVAVIPLDGTRLLVLKHVGTPSRMADLLREVCGAPVDEVLLRATELRLAGNAAAVRGRLAQAAELYSRGLALEPPTGRHLLLSNRSGVRLELGDAEGALEDASAAAACCPPGFTTAAIRQVEGLLKLGQHRSALECMLVACERHPAFEQTDDYRRTLADIQRELQRSGAA
ncbi:tetratricopeptide repeat 1 [Micractinium conductrix]|uniref:Tetratricopeptide repeat 1 n=1 Tax=Micractinium conductrix TaxID=554055 RepID=A0A2P6VML7_9CHLO|nr:tetratricopeptide repeat 1 [Micractinium conductrix]|eukprot:PSC75352.1 tetratricopeptide repeat 1 [Micractinium conductrix]